MGRALIVLAELLVLLGGSTPGQSAGDELPAKKDVREKDKEKEKADEFAFPELVVLDRFAGPWNVAESHFNSRGEVVGSAKGTEEGAWVLDRRALRRTYTSGEEGNPFRAIGMITWDVAGKQYEGSWFDNGSANGPTALTGAWDEASKTMTFTLTSTSTDGKSVQHKVVDRFLDDEHRIATTYRVVGNQVEKVMEVQFTRAVPCPSSFGILPENPSPKKPGTP